MNPGRVYEWNGHHYCNYATPEGEATLDVPATELATAARNPAGFVARSLGVSVEHYLAWHAAGHTVRCASKTRGGERCQNLVRGGSHIGISRWIELQGSYCRLHGRPKTCAATAGQTDRETVKLETGRIGSRTTEQLILAKYGRALLNIEQVADLLDRSPGGLRITLCQSGDLGAKLRECRARIGRRVLFRVTDLAKMLDRA